MLDSVFGVEAIAPNVNYGWCIMGGACALKMR